MATFIQGVALSRNPVSEASVTQEFRMNLSELLCFTLNYLRVPQKYSLILQGSVDVPGNCTVNTGVIKDLPRN